MRAVNYSHARNNLKSLIDDVDQNFEEYLITTKNNTKAMLISVDEYNAMKETLYLLSTPANRERLLESIQQIEAGRFSEKELIEE
ncbi:type II toxin-antitoxin system Phd/YefM family antitoxin [Nitratifractor salsuginis]|uniref:Antitoxin n=1 Tax=Nitratifractor salsuginis (strain DSM 16511 / JCM 12458 / E9I37-1) TaxID=749222 RepID=E6WXQ3_NITSE|nr:type II toxin-antitoxin system prevent-host-death family antitoxin [Nitratifractor salsuginis]ADV46310.1 prevent-host-death family protein [Nitratifractor salsuginis DSM 16511]